MIYYLVQTSAVHPDLARGDSPPGMLNTAERRQFDALKSDKRQREWLLGRWTAKNLLQAIIEQRTGEHVPLDTMTIYNSPQGAPHVTTRFLSDLALSISHCDDQAFCAIRVPDYADWLKVGALLGADIERIEQHTPAFVEDYFTVAEKERVRRAPQDFVDLLITATWSAKEAALKALRVGLTVDTRAVTCRIDPSEERPGGWSRFELSYEDGYLPRRSVPPSGWWCTLEDYVLTVVGDSEPIGRNPIRKNPTGENPIGKMQVGTAV